MLYSISLTPRARDRGQWWIDCSWFDPSGKPFFWLSLSLSLPLYTMSHLSRYLSPWTWEQNLTQIQIPSQWSHILQPPKDKINEPPLHHPVDTFMNHPCSCLLSLSLSLSLTHRHTHTHTHNIYTQLIIWLELALISCEHSINQSMESSQCKI